VLLAGDAALFLDPFTGQGIYLALRSAELAAEVATEALRDGGPSAARLARYDERRQAEFAPKVLLSHLLQGVLVRPWLARRVAGTLRRDLRGAGRLIGVIGDYRPAADLLRRDFLLRLLAAA
jgi:flavin-dependent dehydrogenase